MVFSVFILISSVSSANFYVNNGTTDKNINDWINKTAKTGDNLIFNTQSYNLNSSLIINKSINVLSFKNTVISCTGGCFYIPSKKCVNLTGFTINQDNILPFPISHRISTILVNGEINIKNTIINSKSVYGTALEINGKANIINTIINSAGIGILHSQWKGNLINSKLISQNYGITQVDYEGFFPEGMNWHGNILNSTIISKKDGIYLQNWKGKITNSKIYTNGSKSNGINIKYSKGTINKTKITSKNAYAIKISNDVKISNSSFSSKKGLSKIYRYTSDLTIESFDVIRFGKTYEVKISNKGYSISAPCYVAIKAGNYIKKVKIGQLEPKHPYIKTKYKTTIKIKIPTKYLSKKYMKTIKVDYYNKNKENNKKNNIYKFRDA